MGKLGKIFFFLSGLSLVSFAIVRFLLGAWVPFLWLALGLFVGFLGAGFWMDRAFFKEFFGMKTTKKGLSMGSLILLVLAFLIAVNFIGARKTKTFDFSMGGINTLSEQSVKLLKSLDSELQVIYFYKKGGEGVEQLRRAFIDLLKKYQDQTGNVKLEFVDINQRPDLAEKYEVKKGTQVVYIEYKGRKTRIEKVDEQELTSAIVKVIREKDKTVYFLSGHGEFPLVQAKDGQSLSFLKKLLEDSRYQVKEHSFTQGQEVPKDADMLFVVGPQRNFLEVEVKALEDYLKRGGSLVLALKSSSSNGLDSLLAKVGMKLDNNFIATVLQTPMGNAVDPRATRGTNFLNTHPITKPFGSNDFTVFKLPSSLSKVGSPSGLTIEELVKTNQSSMAFDDLKFNKEGKTGPFTLAVSIKGKLGGAAGAAGTAADSAEAKDAGKASGDKKEGSDKNEFSLVLFGDADFMDDQYLYGTLNRDLVLNTVAYLSKEENLISITPKEVGKTEMNITSTQWTLLILGFIIPLPVLLYFGSGFLWYRRRYS